MKNSLFSVLALVATLFSTTLSANTGENIFDLAGTTVKVSAAQKSIVLNLGSNQSETVSILIKDANDDILVSEKVTVTPNLVKRYNVSQLPNGTYTLTVTKKTKSTVQPFDITKSGLKIAELDKKEKFIPTVFFKNDKLDVNVLLANYGNVTVSILDNEGRNVNTDNNYVVLDLHKRYNLSDLPKGAYIVEVMTGNESFYHTIVK